MFKGVPTFLDMKTANRQTDSGNQATDSLLNLLKPQIPLSLFQKVHTHTEALTQSHTCGCTNKTKNNPYVASVVYLDYKHSLSKLQKL